jgi:hypothetical protein
MRDVAVGVMVGVVGAAVVVVVLLLLLPLLWRGQTCQQPKGPFFFLFFFFHSYLCDAPNGVPPHNARQLPPYPPGRRAMGRPIVE